MFKKYVIFILIIINSFYKFNCSVTSKDTIFTTIIFRHGDRTPILQYPTDPNANYSLWTSLGPGQLTNRGKSQHFALGQWLRERYARLLSQHYRFDEVYIHSTDVDRTIMSALSNLAGLFPPSADDVWSGVHDWQPIPVHTIPDYADNILAGSKKCPKYEYEFNKTMESPIFRKINEKNQQLYAYITEHAEKNINSLVDLSYFYDTLFINDLYNLTLPNWTQPIYPNPLKQWSSISFEVQCFTKTLQRLKIGLLFNEMIERMFSKIHNSLNPNRNMWIYSAHDTTISNVLMGLNLYNFISPPYASALMFELQKRNDSFGISIYFKNETLNDQPYLLKLPNCDEFCEINEFQRILKPILLTPAQWEEECQLGILNNFNDMDSTSVLDATEKIVEYMFYKYPDDLFNDTNWGYL
ncbi:prostatic acid phosphatase-like isoform X2 [Chrysoperla carnea]|uniref:prostatic acid phosphatase-like isoform X2 n=1 Tax=Chrysoperla carnea TaxID=189513 RepID=UPI001D06EF64|nr:prostatic acid phosphatase-like isoform X2 [Chrysoperla carnea]